MKKPANEEIVPARKRIQAGEEVTISYIGSGAAKMKKAVREKALRKVGIEVCLCPLCIKERNKAEERKKGGFRNYVLFSFGTNVSQLMYVTATDSL